MEFRSHVPEPVRDWLRRHLEDQTEPSVEGYLTLLRRAQDRVDEIKGRIERRSAAQETGYLPDLFDRLGEAEEYLAEIRSSTECLERLALDERMGEAYEDLVRVLTDSSKIDSFLFSAWATYQDYSPLRKLRADAAERRKRISSAARTLASEIESYSRTGAGGPSEIYLLSELMRTTELVVPRDDDAHMWEALRPYILGDVPRNKGTANGSQASGPKAHRDPSEVRQREFIQYAWKFQPSIPTLLKRLADACDAFREDRTGFINAAIGRRQHNRKREYLRAFLEHYTEKDDGVDVGRLVRAIATTATVILGNPDDAVDEAEIRSLLKEKT